MQWLIIAINVLLQVVPLSPIFLEPFFKVDDTTSKNAGSKRENNNMANKCITESLMDMEKWISKGT